ncbi:SDR family NAD(P)-dependent oxidoreductase [Marmoricola sp. URHB0036]|uniref:SDR family NAD(P)-dependent oxidoreductase n=1 Tax=Marmoricola sp. URHB0036 TaxID=1298863 RepID=UPI0005644BE1|nr:SDR family NAD(P)-dependent oxidoreductase [Marmoricola sp. URHB0036]
MNLHGAAALVTGASSGIGAATARKLAREGVMVGLVARRWDRLAALAEEVAAAGGTALVVQADITDPDRAAGAVEEVADSFGRLDILVNSAGVMLLDSALHTPLDEWDRMVDLNVRAMLHVTHAAVPHLIGSASTSPRGVADIVNISSTAGRVARPTSTVYNLTKFGMNGFSEALRQELLPERVRVCLVEPGVVSTELLDHVGDSLRDAARRQVDGVEPLRPEDVADAVAYVVRQERRVAINEILLRAADQTW